MASLFYCFLRCKCYIIYTMNGKMCFAAVEFVEDINVVGYTYWYLCPFEDIKEGDKVSAPLGRHNNEQTGIVRKVLFADEAHSPFPLQYIKRIRKVISE